MKLKIISYNVLCYGRDGFFWTGRKDMVTGILNREHPDSFGLQESHYDWMKTVCAAMPDYAYVGAGRDDGKKDGEFSPVFYLKDKFELLDSGTFWLSETPDEMSKDWGAACYRICSYAILRDKATLKEFVVFNTHLDHVSDEARINGIGVVLDKISEFGEKPAILMGDLNAEESSETYKSATQSFLDVKYETQNTMTSCTYQNWGKSLNRNCIDYVLISKTGFTVNSYKVARDTYDGVYPSDHFPLSVSLLLS